MTNLKLSLPDLFYLIVIFLVGLVIRVYQLDQPFGGFQAFNEGFYALLAKTYFNGSLLYPKTWDGGIDYMVPPFHSYWIFFLNILFGVSEFIDRWASVIPNMLTLYVVFLLGKELFNKRVGLISVSLLAVIPMNVVVGRNVQVDATYLFFTLTSLYLYLKSLRGPGLWYSILSGISLGLALFSKQFAVFIYPAIFLWEVYYKVEYKNRSYPWMSKKFFAFLICSLVIPLSFYLYHMLFNSAEFWRIQKLQGGIVTIPTLSLLKFHNAEVFWGFTPLIYFLGGLSVVWFLLRNRQEGETWFGISLLLILFGIYLLFYLCTNKHSYYVLTVAPILSLLIGKLFHDQLKNPILLGGTLGLTLITLIAFSLLTLAGNKYGQKAFRDMGTYLEEQEKSGYYLIVPGNIWGAYGPVIRYYTPSSIMINWDDPSFFLEETGELKIQDNKSIYLIEPFREATQPPIKIFYNELWSWVLLGKAIYQVPINHHFFSYAKIEIRDSEDSRFFGLVKLAEFPVVRLTKFPEDIKIFRNGADFVRK
jgi:4-amino-4-deoxy-L-arabinose transferase-like glycosyltransferase